MVSLQGPVICPAFQSKQVGVNSLMVNRHFPWARLLTSDIWGYRREIDGKSKSRKLKFRNCKTTVHCCFSSSSDWNGSFDENDGNYVNSSVAEADEVVCGPDGIMIKMRYGSHLRCVHNSPQNGHLPNYAPHHAIVLKMEDGTGLLLPIIVLKMPSVLLKAALCNVRVVRPTLYHVIKDMIEMMGYSVSEKKISLCLLSKPSTGGRQIPTGSRVPAPVTTAGHRERWPEIYKIPQNLDLLFLSPTKAFIYPKNPRDFLDLGFYLRSSKVSGDVSKSPMTDPKGKASVSHWPKEVMEATGTETWRGCCPGLLEAVCSCNVEGQLSLEATGNATWRCWNGEVKMVITVAPLCSLLWNRNGAKT
ncbi:Bifunctional nuclease 1 [Hibiscus syriacus]|uniref:Bifunctional nuclease 1 n=1 Tax=Hibiscus syriacus TaxID=106335 RepID=A0A6A3BFM5_HIBSY|nr:Bifunctional nuclease 1 [Hibiscus syriacus]